MSHISMIAAIDEAGGLGLNNQLLTYLPADLRHFKEITIGKPIIMGSTTFRAIGRALPGRLNIVLSRQSNTQEGVIFVSSLEKAFKEAGLASEVMIIGGAQVYAEAITYATRLYITRIHHQFKSDVFFPSININEWSCIKEQHRPKDEGNPYDMTFCTYERKMNGQQTLANASYI